MSTHPNAMLLLVLSPQDLPRKTHLEILGSEGITNPERDIKIGGEIYHHQVMEDDYEEDFQISAPPGSIVFWDLVTYGYGEVVHWRDLDKQKKALEKWAKNICKQHHCSYDIFISANYW